MPPGARCGASPGVLVKSLKPRRTSSDKREASSFSSVNGFFGNSHAAFVVTVAAISGPAIAIADPAGFSAGRAHAVATATIVRKMSVWHLMAGLTYHSIHHAETTHRSTQFACRRVRTRPVRTLAVRADPE